MTSSLRFQSPISPISIDTASTHSLHPSQIRPAKKQKTMSLSETYFLAHTARGKLSREAARGDHDLRLLVGHANLLDGLMLDLQRAERDQQRDSWFGDAAKQRVRGEAATVQWADAIPEEDLADFELDSDDSDSDADSDAEPDLFDDINDEEADVYADDEANNHNLILTRTASHVPDLVHDSDDSDDDSPPSPPQGADLDLDLDLDLEDDFAQGKKKTSLLDGALYFGRTQQRQQAPLIAAC